MSVFVMMIEAIDMLYSLHYPLPVIEEAPLASARRYLRIPSLPQTA
jgi:hypothetical protein